MCRSAGGARWPCGRSAELYVRNLLRAEHVACEIDKGPSVWVLDKCLSGGRDLVQRVIASGNGYPLDPDSCYRVDLDQAKTKQVGIWRDPECLANNGLC